jgi:hypothetical protein
MAFILNKQNDESVQTYFSNSRTLADQQMKIFEELWNMAIPFAIRKKELEYENKKDTKNYRRS